jgi:hypothetical protein
VSVQTPLPVRSDKRYTYGVHTLCVHMCMVYLCAQDEHTVRIFIYGASHREEGARARVCICAQDEHTVHIYTAYLADSRRRRAHL